MSYYLERSKDRLVELRADLKLHQEGIALDQRLQDVQDGNYQAMVISSAYLNTFPNRKVSPDKDSNGTEFYHLTEGESKKPTGLVAVPVESRQNDLWFVVGCLFVVGQCALCHAAAGTAAKAVAGGFTRPIHRRLQRHRYRAGSGWHWPVLAA